MEIKTGIIGCGTIGSHLSKIIAAGEIPGMQLTAVADLDKTKVNKLAATLSGQTKTLSPDELIEQVDLVVECASAAVSASLAEKTLKQGKSILVMSIGGLLGKETLLAQLAVEKKSKIYLPSGALAGLDGVKAAAAGKIDTVILITRKPPSGLQGAPYLLKEKIDLNSLKEEKIVFQGTAEEAVVNFPKNVNVAAALSLAGIGAKKTQVKIIADPSITRNIHEIEVEGEFGRLFSRTENLPSPTNPKTSFLAVLSAVATLKSIVNPLS